MGYNEDGKNPGEFQECSRDQLKAEITQTLHGSWISLLKSSPKCDDISISFLFQGTVKAQPNPGEFPECSRDQLKAEITQRLHGYSEGGTKSRRIPGMFPRPIVGRSNPGVTWLVDLAGESLVLALYLRILQYFLNYRACQAVVYSP
ncbi:hypothetical protein J6590_075935 [Homalodisca vitripennis]|nr:hypothetical protein J6590_075935 [Homalodisca vitripennis]